MKTIYKEFKPTSWAINNKTSIYVLVIIISIFGIVNYSTIPKEQVPDIVIPTILVNTIYPGTSPADMENLITRPLEKNVKSINGVKKITSSSIQDFSIIVVEFNPNVIVADAKQKVKDAVDKTKKDLPNDLSKYGDPQVSDIDLSEIPIMNINLSGNIDLSRLKKYAEAAQDKIESFKEITRVDIVGALDREIQIDVDMYKMQAASVSFYDIDKAVASENVIISGGNINMQGMSRSIRVVGEFKDIEQIKNIYIHTSSGAIVALKDIAEIKDSFKDQESFARLNGQNVITLNVVKKSGQNLLEASKKIKDVLAELEKTKFPSNLKITITNDQSKFTKTTLDDLNNTIIIGFILVVVVLMFFMGLTNAIFVGLSVPLSMALCYIVLPGIGYTMNMLVMFSFIFALGIVVDDAIVVIENTHRIFKQNKGKLNIVQSAKYAAGEVFGPILSGTLTTLAPFFPLAFWPGTIGKFMHFIPVVLILTLFASLVVAYIFNPVFAVTFMKHDDENEISGNKKKIARNALVIAALGVIAHLFKHNGIGNFLFFVSVFFVLHNIFGYKILLRFQHKILPRLLGMYENFLRWSLYKRRPYYLIALVVALLFISVAVNVLRKPKVVLFPAGDPQYIYTYIKLPVGTDVKITDSITDIVEKKIKDVLNKGFKNGKNPIVESMISNVSIGASESMFDRSSTSNKGKITVGFVEFSKRQGISTTQYLDKMREAVKDVPGAQITVDASKMGPPSSGKPINIEISGDNIEELLAVSEEFKKYIESQKIPGIEQLKSDFDNTKPEIVIDIDRERANREGISTAQIGNEIRTAIIGKETSKFREDEDQYPIQIRYSKDVRENIDKLLNLKIIYRDMTTGILRQIPLSAVAKINYENSYGGINRKNLKKVVTLSSNVLTGYAANDINQAIAKTVPGFNKKEGVEISLTGEKEDMMDTQNFMAKAMLLSLCIIMFILVTQFNSTGKTLIILSEVIFCVVGVLLGYFIFGMDFSMVMTGMGTVALGGIVVRNGILLVEFTDVLKERGLKTRDAIVQAGKFRITPVLLTSIATMFGLIPLAVGFNINFETLFTELNPHIWIGGDSVKFFGPLSWTIVFGLGFATFLTLVLIPVMYYIMYAGKVNVKRRKSNRIARRAVRSDVLI
ncbi:MAG: efflux RND transporter permease subunit [Bacteroidales bacterium]|nr:efflux RND transporter permease subunit [Bacteroidales bacterium]